MLANAAERGRQLMGGLVALSKRFPSIIDIRGRGLMVGLELGDRKGGRKAEKGTVAVSDGWRCCQHE
jgi:4-aminobutyrate aminotransferase-like enzyme